MTTEQTYPPGLTWCEPGDLAQLRESPQNPRHLSDEAKERLRYSLRADPEMLKARPIICTLDGEAVCGNMRLRVSIEDAVGGWVFFADLDEKRKTEWMLRDNQEYGEWVPDELAMLMRQHADLDGDMALLGFTEPEVEELLARADHDGGGGPPGGQGKQNPSLRERFGVPPFSVLDARTGTWRDRKRDWLDLGIQSELGRTDLAKEARASEHVQDPRFYEKKKAAEERLGRELTSAEFIAHHYTPENAPAYAGTGTSIFDPVLTELVVRWFSSPGHHVLDAFAGGSVRGIVAAKLGRGYTGIDLSEDQVMANREQAEEIMADDETQPMWMHGDSRELGPADDAQLYDLAFTCPPYFNLERYTDDPRDLSNSESYDDFLSGYRTILANLHRALNDDRFHVLVVGDLRAKDGRQLPLVADSIAASCEAGFTYYGEAILVQPVGSLRIRAARAFVASRKLGRNHQQVLIFVKGDPKKATEAAGELDLDLVQQDADEAADQQPDDTWVEQVPPESS